MFNNYRHIVLITQQQFGYNTDFYYFAKHLSAKHRITYICWDQGLHKIECNSIEVIYVRSHKNALLRSFYFLKTVLLNTHRKSIILIKYFKAMSLLLRVLMPFNHIVLDIRSGAVLGSYIERKLRDTLLRIEAFFFQNITIVSKSLSKALKLDNKATIIPLGADEISKSNKVFKELNLIYVGTLSNRNMEKTILGFSSFYQQYSSRVKMKYTIIGSSPNPNEIDAILVAIKNTKLEGIVKLEGAIPHDKLKSYFDSHNIGVSFIPMTPYYDCQPPTKTFEYLMSGMPVIGTATSEHLKIINEGQNGTLINDTPEAFYQGLVNIFELNFFLNSEIIRNSVINFSWRTIVDRLDSFLCKL